MEIILAILLTGLGLFGGMYFIWKGDHPSTPEEQFSSSTKEYSPHERKKQAV